MPIKIDGGLSAVNRLREEGIVTIGKDRAMTQDIRPLKILILNLMPLKKADGTAAPAPIGQLPYPNRD